MAQCATDWVDQSCCPEDLLPFFIWQSTWVVGRTYAVNSAVEHIGSTWLCVKVHTSDLTNEPPNDPLVNPTTEFWEVMAAGGAIIKWEGQWLTATDYQVNDAVEHLGSAYVALQANNSVEPGTDPLTWDLLVAGQSGTSAGYAQRFVASTDTSVDPGDSNFAINVGDTEIATDDLNIDPADISAWIADFAGGTTPGDLGQVTIKEQASPDEVWKRYRLTAVTVDTGFTRLTVALVDSAGAFTAARAYAVEFARTGDVGGGISGSGAVLENEIASWADSPGATPGTIIKSTGILASDIVQNKAFDANTVLAADTDDTPAPVVIAEQTLLGRITAGVIKALTTTEIRTLINVEDGAQADQIAGDVPFTPAGGVGSTDVQNAIEELDTEKAPAAGNAALDVVQTFTAGQRKQVTEIATWVTAWDIDDSNDFNVTAQVTGAAGNFPVPTETLANGEAQAGEITIDAAAANTAGFAAGWQFPDGTAPDISGGGLFTLYYRIWQDSGGTVRNRITGLAAWS